MRAVVLIVLGAALAAGAAGAAGPLLPRPAVFFTSDFAPDLKSTDLFVVGADGARRRNITSTSSLDEHLIGPSPAASIVAFLRTRTSYSEATDRWSTETSLWVAPLTGGKASRLWTSGLLEGGSSPVSAVRWSPDGRYIALHGRVAPEREALHVVRVSDGALTRLDDAGPGAWLPDSTRLVFSRDSATRREGLRTVRPDGTGEESLTSPGPRIRDVDPVVSADGTRVAFQRVDFGIPEVVVLTIASKSERSVVRDCSGACQPVGLSPDGSVVAVRYTTPRDGLAFSHVDLGRRVEAPFPGAVTWAPDGKRVAIQSDRTAAIVEWATGRVVEIVRGRNFAWAPKDGFAYTAANRIVVRDPDGRERTLARRGATRDEFAALGWSRDRLVFESSIPKNDLEIYVSSPGKTRALTRNDVDDVAASLSPDGSSLAFLRDGSPWVMRPDGSGARRVSRLKAWWVSWWPDGSALLLDRREGMLVLELDGTRRRLLPWATRWSPDGTRLATLRGRTLLAGSADGPLRQVAGGVSSEYFAISPDGTGVVYQRGRTLYLVPSRGGRSRAFARDAEDPDWSEDGRWVAFTRRVAVLTNQKALWLARRDGSSARRLGPGHSPAWSPDGTRLAWVGEGLKVARADGSRVRTYRVDDDYAALYPVWAPDSRWLIGWEEPATFAGEEYTPGMIHVVDAVAGTIRRLNEGYAHEGFGGWASACTIRGTERADRLVGTPGRDIICAFGGNDVVHGRGGDDVLYGGDGNDRLVGGAGYDVLFGARGDDNLDSRDGRLDGVNGGPGRNTGRVDALDSSAGVR